MLVENKKTGQKQEILKEKFDLMDEKYKKLFNILDERDIKDQEIVNIAPKKKRKKNKDE